MRAVCRKLINNIRIVNQLPRRSFTFISPSTRLGNHATTDQRNRVSLVTIANKYRKNIPITMVTAYDYPSAVHVDMVWALRSFPCAI